MNAKAKLLSITSHEQRSRVTFHRWWWPITKECIKHCWEWSLKKSMCVLISFGSILNA